MSDPIIGGISRRVTVDGMIAANFLDLLHGLYPRAYIIRLRHSRDASAENAAITAATVTGASITSMRTGCIPSGPIQGRFFFTLLYLGMSVEPLSQWENRIKRWIIFSQLKKKKLTRSNSLEPSDASYDRGSNFRLKRFLNKGAPQRLYNGNPFLGQNTFN